MNPNELDTLLGKTAMLMETFERRAIGFDERHRLLSSQLQALVQQLPEEVKQSADTSLHTLPGEILAKVQAGLDQPVGQYEQRLREAGTLLQDGSQTLAQQLRRLERLHKHLVWKVVGITATCLLVLLVGGGWLSSHYYRAVRENQIAADLLKAYNTADVVVCGDRLCVNVDPKGKRFGENGQYLPARNR